MIHKTPLPQKRYTRVLFSIPGTIWADKISLVGDFNDWNDRSHPLQQATDGSWQTALDLPAGKQYEFRYWVDGEWIPDVHADGFSTAPEGIHNAIVYT